MSDTAPRCDWGARLQAHGCFAGVAPGRAARDPLLLAYALTEAWSAERHGVLALWHFAEGAVISPLLPQRLTEPMLRLTQHRYCRDFRVASKTVGSGGGPKGMEEVRAQFERLAGSDARWCHPFPGKR